VLALLIEAAKDDTMATVEIRRLTLAELHRVAEIDVSEEGNVNYRVVEGRLEANSRRHRRLHFTIEDWRPVIADWRVLLEEGGAAFGAFVAARLIGIAVVRYRLTDEMSQLTELYVDRAHRRVGVGGALVDRVESAARVAGLKRLYAPPRRRIRRCRSTWAGGFSPLAEPDPHLFAREPDDIHMAKTLVSPYPNQ
jgi:GNAT superfamily N-acetyltransferase